jgi:hypothetical protein
VAQSEAERRRRGEREARQRAILQQRIQEVKQEMVELRHDIDSCLTEVESCFTLLLPRFELPDIYTSSDASQVSVNQNTDQEKSRELQRAPGSSKFKARRLSSLGSFVSLSEGSGSDGEGGSDCGVERARKRSIGLDIRVAESPKSGDNLLPTDVVAHTSGDPLPTSVSACSDLLPASIDSASSTDSDSDVEWEDVLESTGWNADMQEHGMAAHSFSVPVQLSGRVEVKETDDNSSILSSLRERRLLLVNHHLPNLNKCLEVSYSE